MEIADVVSTISSISAMGVSRAVDFSQVGPVVSGTFGSWVNTTPGLPAQLVYVGGGVSSPVSCDLVVDVKVDGVSVFANPSDRLTIHSGSTANRADIPLPTVDAGQRVTVDVVSATGSDLALTLGIDLLSLSFGGTNQP